jgi:acyl-CoA thioester hydrolase
MDEFSRSIQIRWSDLDPNFHIRHSVYYDWGAYCRVEFLNEMGLTAHVMQELHFGPILFREECIFRREIRSGDKIRMTVEIIRAKKDFTRWSIRHQIIKEDGTLCAILTVDGAWLDLTRRKLATPPEMVYKVFEQMPRSEDFEWSYELRCTMYDGKKGKRQERRFSLRNLLFSFSLRLTTKEEKRAERV